MRRRNGDALDVRLVASGRPAGGKTFAGLALSRDDGTLRHGRARLLHPGDRPFQKRAEKLTGEPRAASQRPPPGTAPQNGHLYVGHPSADNAGSVYRLGTKKGACALVAGDVNKHEDGATARVPPRFSRPHQMAAFRANELLLTDIDNRAVRRCARRRARPTVPYDNNHLYTELWRLGGPQRHDHGQYVYPRRTTGGDRDGGGRRLRGPRRRALPARRAARRRHAEAPPAERRVDESGRHSCWLHWPGECPRPRPTSGKEAHLRRLGRRAGWSRVGAGCSLRVRIAKKRSGRGPFAAECNGSAA